MPLRPIPNQPITFEPAERDDCNRGDNKFYCALYQPCDTLYFQFQQTPCDENDYFCGGNFFDNLRPGLLGGDFENDQDFVLTTGSWSIASGIATDTGGSGYIKLSWFNNSNATFGSTSYEVTVEVLSYTSGDIQLYDGNSLQSFGVSGIGTYSLNVTSPGNRVWIKSNSFVGAIDNVAMNYYTNDCIVTTNKGFDPVPVITSGWTIDLVDGISHVDGYDNYLLAYVSVPGDRDYQQVIIEFENIVSGSVTITNGLVGADAVVSQSGIYTFYMSNLHFDGRIEFKPSSDFVGTIKSINVYTLNTDYSIYLLNEDNSIYLALNPYISYEKDFLTVKYDTCNVPEGCYRIGVFDPCGENTNREEVSNPTFSDLDQWTADTGGYLTPTFYDGYVELVNFGFLGFLLYPPPSQDNLVCEGTHRVYITFGDVEIADTEVTINLQCGGTTSQTFTVNSNQTVYFDIIEGTSSILESIGFSYDNEGRITVTKVSVKPLGACGSQSGVNNISNCITFSTVQECAKQVEGYSDGEKNDLGFYFSPENFRLSSRYKVLKFNPYYPVESEDYRYSDGYRKLIYAEREKFYEVLFDYIDEDALDALTAMFLCEVFTVDGVQYYVKPEDFKPEWAKDGGQMLAQLRVQMRKVNGTIYHSKR